MMISDQTPDEQLAAFLMAVVCRGMTEAETDGLLDAMLAGGTRLSWPWPVADKHSTGGVGDKTTLVVAPLVAACGVPAGQDERPRPGPHGRHARQAGVDPRLASRRCRWPRCGSRSSGSGRGLRPDRRSGPGRRPPVRPARPRPRPSRSLPLIATSIMAKKIAAGATRLVLDVKAGEGAFLPDQPSARRAGRADGAAGHAATASRPRRSSRRWTSRSAARSATRSRWRRRSPPWRGGGPDDLRELALEAAGMLVGDERRVRRALESGERARDVSPLDRAPRAATPTPRWTLRPS